jgi:hypothetical protein
VVHTAFDVVRQPVTLRVVLGQWCHRVTSVHNE